MNSRWLILVVGCCILTTFFLFYFYFCFNVCFFPFLFLCWLSMFVSNMLFVCLCMLMLTMVEMRFLCRTSGSLAGVMALGNGETQNWVMGKHRIVYGRANILALVCIWHCSVALVPSQTGAKCHLDQGCAVFEQKEGASSSPFFYIHTRH